MTCALISPAAGRAGELIRAAERFAKGLDPVLFERVLQGAHERAFDPQLHVMPMFRVLRVARPLFRKTDSTSETHPSIHYQDAPVRAPVRAINPPREERMVIGEFTAGVFHHPDVGIVQAPTGAHAVEQDAHFHPGPGAFNERVAKSPADFVRIKNVGLEIDCFLRAANRCQHRAKIAVAVLEQLDLVAGHRHRIVKRESGAEELWIVHPEGMLDAVLDNMAANEKNAEDRHDPKKREDNGDPLQNLKLPPIRPRFFPCPRHRRSVAAAVSAAKGTPAKFARSGRRAFS